MASALIDTSIVVDLLRGHPPAQTWFSTQNDLAASRIVWMEIIEGAPNRRAQQDALKLLRRFQVMDVIPSEAVWATQQLLIFNLSHNVDAFDCLIASTSHRLQLPLYTRNLKHFTPLLGPLAQQPY